jgi:hypothetical protein
MALDRLVCDRLVILGLSPAHPVPSNRSAVALHVPTLPLPGPDAPTAIDAAIGMPLVGTMCIASVVGAFQASPCDWDVRATLGHVILGPSRRRRLTEW